MKSNKKKIMSIIGIVLLILLIISATYAYFSAQGAETKTRDVRIITDTTDSLLFEIGKDLSITANQDIFSQGKGNQTDSTTAKAILRANNTTNSATDNYYLYIDISSNDFEYTTSEKTAELILTIIKPDKTPLTSIEGLTPVTVNGVSGFDITEASGIIKIAENKEITATSANNNTTTDEWVIEITFINLETNQAANGGKSIEAKIKMQKTKEETLAEHIISTYGSDETLYLHDENLVNGAKDNSYRFSGNNYSIAESYKERFVSIDNSLIIYNCNGTDRSNLPAINCAAGRPQYYYLGYDENKTQYATYEEAVNQAVSDGALISTPINNYVCFGSDEETCPYDSLYRIIGVFGNKVKLIKADYATKDMLGEDGTFLEESDFDKYYLGKNDKNYKYQWGQGEFPSNESNWSKSHLNKINLNTNFINYLGNIWANKIDTNEWQIAHQDRDIMRYTNAYTVYSYELGSNKINDNFNYNCYINGTLVTDGCSELATYKTKVGLMYLSEYYYAADPRYWTYPAYSESSHPDSNGNYGLSYGYNAANKSNWLSLQAAERFLTVAKPNYENGRPTGFVTSYFGFTSVLELYSAYSVRPTFYLKSNIKYLSGTGTELDPYRIA